MNIILVAPYYSQLIEYYSFYRPASPTGLLYISSYLRKHQISSKILDLGVFEAKDAVKIDKRVRFGLSDEADDIMESVSLDIAYTPTINRWKGTDILQLDIADLKANLV